MPYLYGVADTVGFVTRDSSGVPTVPTTPVPTIDIDGAGFGAAANAVTSLGNGACSLALTAGEMTGTLITVRVASDNCLDEIVQVRTEANWTLTRAGYLDAAITSRVAATVMAGITSLAQWLGLMAGKQVGNETARTELRATGAGSGTYDETTDSQEAIRDTAPLGTAMRGTDGAALATVCTEPRLAELDAGSLPGVLDTVAVDVAGLDGAAMRGTDGAALASAYTSGRAAYLDNLNIGGNVASSAEVVAIQNNTRCVRVVPAVIERPDTGTTTYRIELLLYDAVGNMEAPDSAPTVALVDQAGTDLSARLDSATMALVTTGRYRAVYTATATDDLEQLVWTFSVVEGGQTRLFGNTSLIVDTSAVDFTAADRTKLDALHDDRLTATRAGYLDRLNVTGTLAHSDAAATYKADVSALALEETLAEIKGAGWTTETLKAIADAALTQAGVRSAVGLAAADLDTQLAALAVPGDEMALTSAQVTALVTAVLTGDWASWEAAATTGTQVGHALAAARTYAFGRMVIDSVAGTAIFYEADGLTVIATFTLTPTATEDGERSAAA